MGLTPSSGYEKLFDASITFYPASSIALSLMTPWLTENLKHIDYSVDSRRRMVTHPDRFGSISKIK
jgi:hypothetical protein